MANAKPKAAIRKANRRKQAECKCLLCTEEVYKRGLCDTHYSRYRTARTDVAPEQRPLFEIRLIKAGKLLPSRQGQRLDVINEFRKEG